MSRPLRPSMEQTSDGEQTQSSRPAFRGLPAASVMVFRFSLVAVGNDCFYHTPLVTSRRALPYTALVRESRLAVVDFYDRHPINEAQVLESARAHAHRFGDLRPEDLWQWDQDHYGGGLAGGTRPGRAAARPARGGLGGGG